MNLSEVEIERSGKFVGSDTLNAEGSPYLRGRLEDGR